MDMSAASPPMSRKSLLLPSRRTRPRRKRRCRCAAKTSRSDSKTVKPAVQPENPNPSGTESVTIYVPDEQGETLTPTGADAKDDSDQSLVDALIAAGSLPEGVKVQSSSLENGTLTLDMNAAFGEAIRASGTAGETLKIYALVNTFAQARGATAVLITVDGKVLESGHEVYDYAIEPNN